MKTALTTAILFLSLTNFAQAATLELNTPYRLIERACSDGSQPLDEAQHSEKIVGNLILTFTSADTLTIALANTGASETNYWIKGNTIVIRSLNSGNEVAGTIETSGNLLIWNSPIPPSGRATVCPNGNAIKATYELQNR